MSYDTHVILGPPGTGKTTALANWIKQTVHKYGASEVMVCSLTKAAAREIAGRGLGVASEQVGTLHSFAYHALGRPKMTADPEIMEKWNETCGDATWKIGMVEGSFDCGLLFEGSLSSGDSLLSAVSTYRNTLTPPRAWRGSEYVRLHRAWTKFKAQEDVFDFTDLIELAGGEGTCPGDPSIAFIDEGQDLTPLEFRLITKWAADMDTLVVAGDDDQALYEFRGARPENLLEIHNNAASTRTLKQSYRLTHGAVRQAESFIKSGIAPGRRAAKVYTGRDNGGHDRHGARLSCTSERPDSSFRESLLADIERGDSAMVLAASAYHLRAITEALRSWGVRYHNPYRLENRDWNPVPRLAGWLAHLCGGDVAWSWGRARQLIDLVDHRRAGVKLAMAKCITAQSDDLRYRDLAISRESFAEGFEGPVVFSTEFFRKTIKRRLIKKYEYALDLIDQHRLEEEPRVVVGTIHSVKGAEADHVYLCPDITRKMYDGAIESGRKESLYRMFYVGLTRCRETLKVFSPRKERLSLPLI